MLKLAGKNEFQNGVVIFVVVIFFRKRMNSNEVHMNTMASQKSEAVKVIVRLRPESGITDGDMTCCVFTHDDHKTLTLVPPPSSGE